MEKYVNTITGFREIIPTRMQKILSASSEIDSFDPARDLANRLHPDKVYLVIEEIVDETPDIKSFKMVPNTKKGTTEIPVFRPGQYVSISATVNGSPITRPYSIASTPEDAYRRGFLTLAIKKTEGGFFTDYIWKNWKIGTEVTSSAPLGFFHYDKIRDSKNLVGLCGGSGVTPMRCMIKNLVEKNWDLTFTLFYGAKNSADFAYKTEFESLAAASNGKVKLVFVASEPDSDWTGETGFITADLIQKHINVEGKTLFICGPRAMYAFLDKELPKLNIPRRRIRKEMLGSVSDVAKLPAYPVEKKNQRFKIIVNVGQGYTEINADATDSILVTLEKAGIAVPSHCRSGECGYCRSRLISGEVYVNPDSDGRRIGDLEYGYIHPCSTYPISDLEIEVPVIER